MTTAVRIIRAKEVCKLAGIKRSTLYKWMAEGRFVRPVKLGTRNVGWRSDEVEHFVASLPRTTAA